ncbi:unnamed protein product [Brassicogethes aeneus]|uniref:ATP synthase subunit s-like protein n=1 Tax=Brassicogethes aeneus TaxID=1431903 RepID=A0A9P0FC45_BRAAE|nr:unnamed protein product [Brassicogethes aeneus]
MLSTLKPAQLLRNLVNQCRLCSTKAPDSNLPANSKPKEVKTKKYDQKDISASDMQWRREWHENHGTNYNMLRTFYTEDNKRSWLQIMQTKIDLSPAKIKNWWAEKKEVEQKYLQSYLPERNQRLGNELAAAHFLVFRGGAVKFHGQDKWIKGDSEILPNKYDSTLILQGIDCSDMPIHYEGLVNLRALKNVEWLSLRYCDNVDDWFLDTISNIFSDSLLYLDLRDCKNITERGLGALYKMRNLKILYIDDLLKATSYEMTCLLLQEVNPMLDIKSDKVTFDLK